MLEVARAKASSHSLERPIEWIELGALEIEDRFPESSFDAVVSSLMFSELLPEEQDYVLATAFTRLRPGGTVVIGDETVPDTRAGRFAHALRRLPSTALTYLFAQSTTRPVTGLAERLRRAGFEKIDETFFDHHTFVVAQGWKPK
jgi:ubiquinone/menaquinone biosynthesis C-methylase UbiE